jgi:MscS family membrane protein
MNEIFGYELSASALSWIKAIAAVVAIVIGGDLIGRGLLALLGRAVRRTSVSWDDALLERLSGPLRGGCVLAIGAIARPWFALDHRGQAVAGQALLAATVVVMFWLLLRIVDVGRTAVEQRPWARDNPSSRSVLSIGSQTVKALLFALGLLTMLATLGVPITSMIAGLGIGGLAIALAAQKTLENLFGTYSIGLDQPFREGDFVRVDDLTGTIEAIGLRSTRLRTLNRTTVLIPNGQLADARTESFTARDRIRLACTIGLVYETKAAQIRRIRDEIEALLRAHPLIWPDTVIVRFKELAAYSLDLEVIAWFQTTEWSEFQAIREEILLGFMDIVERNGSSFAFPSRTIHLAPSNAAPPLPSPSSRS